MATYQAIAQEIIELHEKLNYDESTAIRPRVLEAINRAINHIWSKADWTFRVRVGTLTYNPSTDTNALPSDFLSFQHTGQVVLLSGSGGDPTGNLSYIPFNRMMNILKGSRPEVGTPEVYSLGGQLDGGSNIRSIFLYPKPSATSYLRLIYQAKAPTSTLAGWATEIPSIPTNWHYSVIKEVAILFRLMDKSADITAQVAIVKTAIDAMMRDEPHGREDTPMMQPFLPHRMNVRNY